MSITIKLYDESKKNDWDCFLDIAKNSHFMFKRGYMDYHAKLFNDFSLMFYNEKSQLIAILPANIKEDKLHSHQGLTFGGLVVSLKATTELVHIVFLALLDFLKAQSGINSFIYKRMPDFYCNYSTHEDLYALFLLKANLYRRDVSSLIDLNIIFPYTKGRKWSINKAKKNQVVIKSDDNLSEFWVLLSQVLKLKYGTKPVHSLEEINLLRLNFPKNIKCFTARLGGELLAGALIYETDDVVHTQYLANSERGRDIGALDLVVDHLLKNVYKDKKYFDFGISTEENGQYLNKGLIAQKEGFGARAFVQDCYEIKVE